MMKQPAFPAEPQPDAGCFLQNMEETRPSQAGKYAVPCRKMTPGSKPIPLALPSLWQKHSRGAFRLPGGLFLRLLGGQHYLPDKPRIIS